jgi:hypothetical protein
MSLNPVEIEFRKPGSFGYNQALARLLGDSFRPNQISNSLPQVLNGAGGGGGGGGNPFFSNFVATYDLPNGIAHLTWENPTTPIDGLRLECSDSTEYQTTDYSDTSLTSLDIPINLNVYDSNSLTWHLCSLVGGDLGTCIDSEMFFAPAPEFVKAGYDPDSFAINIGWTYPIDTSYVKYWEIREDSLFYNQQVFSGTFASFSADPQWVGQTLNFYVIAYMASGRILYSQPGFANPVTLGSLNPVVLGVEAHWNPDTGNADLSWLDMRNYGTFDEYELSSNTDGHYVNQTTPKDQTSLSIPLNISDYTSQMIIWTFKTLTTGNGFSGDAFAYMYWTPQIQNLTANFVEGDGTYIQLNWSYPYTDVSLIDHLHVTETTFGIEFDITDLNSTGYALNFDEAWRNSTMNFQIQSIGTTPGWVSDYAVASVSIPPANINYGNNPGIINSLTLEENTPAQLSSISPHSVVMDGFNLIAITFNDQGLFNKRGSIALWFNAATMGDIFGYGLFSTAYNASGGINLGLTSSGDIVYGQAVGELMVTYDYDGLDLLSNWHHVVLTWDQFNVEGTNFNTYNLFIDGVQVVSDGQVIGEVELENNFPVIGAASGGLSVFQGNIDQVIYSMNTFYGAQVTDIYNGSFVPGNEERVVYTFEGDQDGANQIIDHSVNYSPPS